MSSGYRCRHGHNGATTPQPDRPHNAYVRQDLILAHLPALVLRLTAAVEGAAGEPPTALDAVEYLRASGITLTYDAAAKALSADTRGSGEDPDWLTFQQGMRRADDTE